MGVGARGDRFGRPSGVTGRGGAKEDRDRYYCTTIYGGGCEWAWQGWADGCGKYCIGGDTFLLH